MTTEIKLPDLGDGIESGDVLDVLVRVEPKLRTVIWNYAGEPVPAGILADLCSLDELLTGESQLGQALVQLLSEREVAALRHRLRHLIETGRFPEPGPGRVVPWPLV